MEPKTGTIEIHITGNNGNESLSPDNFDIREVKKLLDGIEDMLYPNNKQARPTITYSVESGSVRNIFRTSLQAVASFTAILNMIAAERSIDNLEVTTARAFENIQQSAKQSNYSFEFMTSQVKEAILKITPDTNYFRNEDLWADAEFFFYGELINAGGKNEPNIHLVTKEAGTLLIDVDKEFLKQQDENILYKEYGVRVQGKQNIATGELDKRNLKLLELVDYNSRFDEQYLSTLISKVGNKFSGIDVDNWINEIRGKA
jgi:hypothetical protein